MRPGPLDNVLALRHFSWIQRKPDTCLCGAKPRPARPVSQRCGAGRQARAAKPC